MKKAFTMIELIFIIVILGILAAIAIPKLAATRDDAELSKAATNLSTAVQDLAAFYTSQGNFEDKLSRMTNVQLTDAAGNPATGRAGYLRIKGKNCAYIQAVPGGSANGEVVIANDSETSTASNPAFVYVMTKSSLNSAINPNGTLEGMALFDENGDPIPMTNPTFDPDPICDDFAELPGVKGVVNSESPIKMCEVKKNGRVTCEKTAVFKQGVHLVGGRGVKYEV